MQNVQKVQTVYDKIAVEWNEYKQVPLPAFQLLLKYGRDGGSDGVCLDAGTGNGRHLPLLSKKYKEVYAIDNSAKLLEIAKQNHPQLSNVHFQFADIVKMPFADNFFDDVYVVAVLHHLTDQKAALAFKEIHRVLKPGELFIASVWNKHQPRFDKVNGNEADVPWKLKNGKIEQRFVHFFEKDDIERLAKENNFEIVEIFYELNGTKQTRKENAGNLCFVLRKAQ